MTASIPAWGIRKFQCSESVASGPGAVPVTFKLLLQMQDSGKSLGISS